MLSLGALEPVCVYGHKMPEDYILIQDRSQLRAYKKDVPEPEERGHEVYVSMLPRDILIQYIYMFLERCGEIYDIRLLMDFSGFNRGMSYVKFVTKLAARKAAILLDGCEIKPDHPLNIKMSFENCQLVIQNVPKQVPHDQVKEVITKLIGEGLMQTSVVSQKVQEESNSYLLVYDCHRRALEARRRLWPGIEQWGKKIPIDWMEPPELKLSRALYFKNVPENTTKSDLFDALYEIIDIHTVLKLKQECGVGYIILTSDASRKAAHNILSDSLVFGRKLQLSYKKFPVPKSLVENSDVESSSKVDEMSCNSASRAVPYDDTTPFFEYESCIKGSVEKIPVFYPPAVSTKPEFGDELESIKEMMQTFVKNYFPKTVWKCLNPKDKKLPNHYDAVRLRPTINGETYEFVLLCVSPNMTGDSPLFPIP